MKAFREARESTEGKCCLVIGDRIRDKRGERAMSLRDLAERTGLTPSFLSQVERSLTEPSLTSLRKIADGLDVPIFYFLLDDSDGSPVVRRGERKVLTFPGKKIRFELLTPNLNHKMEIVTACMEPGSSTCEDPLSHSGEEFITVVEGSAEIQVGGQEYELQAGDSIYFFASIPHKVTSIGSEDLVIIMAITPPTF